MDLFYQNDGQPITPMNRIAILVDKNLESGAAANAAALLMGQAVRMTPDLYAEAPVLDRNGVCHAGIRYSTIILKAGINQLLNLIQSLNTSDTSLQFAVFSRTGQAMNNAFEQYALRIASMPTEETGLSGMVLWGSDEKVRAATKKFSVFG